MNLEEFQKRLEDGCQKLNLPTPRTARQGFSFTKFELRIGLETSIEIYFNEETNSLTSALIRRNERIFGTDDYPTSGGSHLHPLGRVEEHLKISPMQIEEILEEYVKILRQL